MNRNIIFLIIVFCTDCFGWTWNYNRVFDSNSLKIVKSAEYQSDTPEFTQLIFSFNSVRPYLGKFEFYVSVHLKDKGWTAPYKVTEWGRGVQKTLHVENNKSSDPTNYFVRYEIPKYSSANGFKITVKPNRSGILHNLKSISVCVSDFDQFESQVGEKINLPSLHIKGVPTQSQLVLKHKDATAICSPTSLAMVLSYLLKKRISFEKFATRVFDHGLQVYGSWSFNVAAAFEIDNRHNFRVERQPSFKALYAYLQKGYPVVVSVRGKLRGAPKSYPGGHLLVVVGWDNKNKKVLVHDPAFPETNRVFTKYYIRDFLAAWERSYYLSYVVEPFDELRSNE